MSNNKLSKAQLKSLRQSLISASDAGLHAAVVGFSERYLSSEPESLRAMLDRCTALIELRRFDAARKSLEEAFELAEQKGDNPDVIYGMMGNLHQAKGEFSRAEEMYRQQIKSDPTDATGFFFLATLLADQGRADEAIQEFEKGLNCIQGPIELIHTGIGNARRSQFNFPAAVLAYEKALKIDSKLEAAKSGLRDVKLAIAEQPI